MGMAGHARRIAEDKLEGSHGGEVPFSFEAAARPYKYSTFNLRRDIRILQTDSPRGFERGRTKTKTRAALRERESPGVNGERCTRVVILAATDGVLRRWQGRSKLVGK